MGKVDYRGFIGEKQKQGQDFMITVQFSWDEDLTDSDDGALKAVGGTMLGTSPEFEMAMYTVAWVYGKENNVVNIPIVLEDQKFHLIAHVLKGEYLGTCYISRPTQRERR